MTALLVAALVGCAAAILVSAALAVHVRRLYARLDQYENILLITTKQDVGMAAILRQVVQQQDEMARRLPPVYRALPPGAVGDA